MNDKDSYQEGDVGSNEKNKTHRKKKHSKKKHQHRHKRTSDISFAEEDLDLGKSQGHGHEVSKKQTKYDKNKGVASLKKDADYDDFIECLAETDDGAMSFDVKHTLALSDCNQSLENKGKRM